MGKFFEISGDGTAIINIDEIAYIGCIQTTDNGSNFPITFIKRCSDVYGYNMIIHDKNFDKVNEIRADLRKRLLETPQVKQEG